MGKGAQKDPVSIDEIQKDHVRKEIVASKHWASKFQYYKDENIKMQEEMKALQAETSHLAEETSDWRESLPVARPEPSPKMPTTTAGRIGWRSSLQQYKLEIYGDHGNCRRGDIVKKFEWPSEGL